MFSFVLGLIFGVIALAAFAISFNSNVKQEFGVIPRIIGGVVSVVAIVLIVLSTTLYVSADKAGIVAKKFGRSLDQSAIVAVNGEKGPQAEVLTPGWHFFYWPWMYELSTVELMKIPQGQVGVVTAKDGEPLPAGEIYGREWESPNDMIDAVQFLTDGGQKGPQLTVLPPGSYRYNPYLFDIETKPALDVEVGTVAVIKANAGDVAEETIEEVNGVPIVENGKRGIWHTALTPNQYYLHPNAYNVIIVQTTNRIYSYTSPSQLRNKSERPADDNAIHVRTKDGFEFPVDIRVSIKIDAEDAPYVVAMLGDPDADKDNDGFDKLEEVVVLPAVRAIFRNSAETRGAIEYVNTRSEIEKSSTQAFQDKLHEFRVDSDGIFVADIGLSKTEEGKTLLRTQTDKEVAKQEQETWLQKKEAEIARAESVRAAKEADVEADKVQAEVSIEIAKSEAKAAIEEATGRAEAATKEIEALGGYSNFILREVANNLTENGFELPEVLVIGDGGQLDTAVLGKLIQNKPVKVDTNE